MDYLQCANMCRWRSVLYKIWVVFLIYFVLPGTSGFGHLEKDLKILSNLFPGHYSNKEQYISDVDKNLPSDKRHLSMQIICRPVKIHFLPNSFSVYVEKYINYERTPFKQWLYNFRTDYKGMVIDMQVYDFRTEKLKKRLQNNFKIIQLIGPDNVTSNEDCNMLWRRLGAKKFIGTTRRQCIANIKGEKVRIAMSGTLTATLLQWHEGWYRLQDGKQMLKAVSPYIMKKIRKIKGVSYTPSDNQEVASILKKKASAVTKSEKQDEQGSVLITPAPPKRPSSRALYGGSIMNDRLATPRKRKSWKLHDFRGVLDALVEGRRVHYAANIESCTLAGNKDVENTAFGDFIDVFEIHRSNGDNGRNFIKFSNMHKVKENSDFVDTLRDVTLYADGTSVMDIYTIETGKNQIIKQTMAVCRFYTPRTRVGDVRFTVDPRHQVRIIKNFRSLRHNLQKGKGVRLLTDLTQCTGSDERRMILGGEIKGYDISKSGEEIEVTMERMVTESNSENIVSFRHFDGKFTSSNMATMTLTDRGLSKNIFNQYGGKETRHRCALSKSTTNISLLMFHL